MSGEPAARVLRFADLDARTAYAVWRLRQDVFVVEQRSPYPDLDGRDLDPTTRHVLLVDGADVVGYLRMVDDGGAVRVGRVVVAPAARGRGLADRLVAAALAEADGRPVVLDAQSGLAEWYARRGFEVVGPEFDDEGVRHVPMRRPGVSG